MKIQINVILYNKYKFIYFYIDMNKKYIFYFIIIFVLILLFFIILNIKYEFFILNDITEKDSISLKLGICDKKIYIGDQGNKGKDGDKGDKGDKGLNGIDGMYGKTGIESGKIFFYKDNYVDGLEWKNIGITKPKEGRELKNEKLLKLLKQKTVIEYLEYEKLNIKDLHYTDFVKIDNNYYRPETSYKKYGEYDNIFDVNNTDSKIFLYIPDGIRGKNGKIPPIRFIAKDHKYFVEEGNDFNVDLDYDNQNIVIGKYDPIPKNNLKPIIVKVPNGKKGDEGDKGKNGKCIVGETGPKGDIGIKGPDGLKGPKGDKGKDGEYPDNILYPTFDNVTINDSLCWGDKSENICLDISLLEAIIKDKNEKKRNENNPYYLSILNRRKNRLIKELCKIKRDSTTEYQYNVIKNKIYETNKFLKPDVELNFNSICVSNN